MRKRWIYPEHGEPYEVGPGDIPVLRGTITDAVLWNDRMYQDCGDPRFNSRTTHREYMKRNGLTLADDYKGEWAKARERRVDYYTRSTDPSRKHDVERAVDMVSRGHKPHRQEEE